MAGLLAGRSVEFDVDVLRATDERLELVAHGPISINVEYTMRTAGIESEVEAVVSVEGRGVFGRLLAKAAETLLSAGALRMSLDRLAGELQPAVAA